MAKQSDAWVFVSHSNRDLADVRRVRNELESQSANPILFILKCVEDHHELDALIEREIVVRQRARSCGFILIEHTDCSQTGALISETAEYCRQDCR
jgi:hypothetical protein